VFSASAPLNRPGPAIRLPTSRKRTRKKFRNEIEELTRNHQQETEMNKKLIALFAITTLVLLSAVAGWSQMLARVHGKVIGVDGNPMVGLDVQFVNSETGQKSDLKTDNKGEFASIAITPGKYTVNFVQDGKIIHFYKDVPVRLSEQGNEFDFNLQKETKEAQKSPQNVQQVKETAKINTLNDKLKAAKASEDAAIAAGNEHQTEVATTKWNEAIQTINDALAIDQTHDVIYAVLGDAELGAGGNATNKDEATAHFQKAIEAYQKAIELLDKSITSAPPTMDKKALGDMKIALGKYHNNLGQAYAKSGDSTAALKEYSAAAEQDAPNAHMYYFNAGATLTNMATRETSTANKDKEISEANEAFDKAIAAKPDYAEAYYQKGINLTSKATIDKSGKMIPAPGTIEAFSKYLELEPDGKHAEEAKGLIEGFGETVQTSYKKPKTTPTKSK
jgi:tetratricopeptide (TPR) repeat protein